MLSVLSYYSGDDGDGAVKPERQNSTGNMLKRLGSSRRLSGVARKEEDYLGDDHGQKVSYVYVAAKVALQKEEQQSDTAAIVWVESLACRTACGVFEHSRHSRPTFGMFWKGFAGW